MQLNIEQIDETVDEVAKDVYQKANHFVENKNDLYSPTKVNNAVGSFIAIMGIALVKRREDFFMKYDGFQKALA